MGIVMSVHPFFRRPDYRLFAKARFEKNAIEVFGRRFRLRFAMFCTGSLFSTAPNFLLIDNKQLITMVSLTLTVALSREALWPGLLYNTHCYLRSPLLLPCTHHPAKELLWSLGKLNHYLSRILRNGRVTEKYGAEEYLFLCWVHSGCTLTVICLSKYIVYQYSQLELLLVRECVTVAHSAQARCS